MSFCNSHGIVAVPGSVLPRETRHLHIPLQLWQMLQNMVSTHQDSELERY